MPEPGPGAEGGGVWGSMQQQEKASGFAIQLPSNLLSSKAASLRGRPVSPLYCVCSYDMVYKQDGGFTPRSPAPQHRPAHRFSLRSPQDGSIFCLGSPRRPTSTSLARFPRRPEHGTAPCTCPPARPSAILEEPPGFRRQDLRRDASEQPRWLISDASEHPRELNEYGDVGAR